MNRTRTRAERVAHCRADRSLHLIDLENMLGGSGFSAGQVVEFWSWYTMQAVGVGPGDHVAIATGSRSAATAWFALPASGIRRLVRPGVDGADWALLDAVDLARDAARFGRLVIASGDHVFAPLALQARDAGMRVHQVIGAGYPSHRLMAACPTHTWPRGRTTSHAGRGPRFTAVAA